MTKRVIYLSDWQVLAWQAGRLKALFIPMRPQPPRGWVLARNPESYEPGDQAFMDPTHPIETYPALFSNFTPGDVLLGKEAWMWADHTQAWDIPGCKDERVVYKADHPDSDGAGWRSPATMPREAVRIYMPVAGVSAVRMRDTTDTTAVMAGIEYHERCEEDVEFAGAVGGCTGNIRRSWFEREWHKRYGSRYPWDTAWSWRIEVRQWK